MNRNKRMTIEDSEAITAVHERPSPPRPDSTLGPTLNAPQRYTVRVALATAGTIATLIGAQALALLDRTVNTQPVKVGVRFGSPTPQPKPKPSLNLSDDSNNDENGSGGGPSLNLNGSEIISAPDQPLPLTLSS
jgi:hypothetical protein